jgi:Tol biopolymer transport system component
MDVLDHEGLKADINNKHWLEHIMLNSSGSRFAFYHRYGSDEEYCTRVFTADTEGKEIWAHPHKNGNNYSHLGWAKNDTYVLYTMPEKTTLSAWKNVERKKSGIRQIPLIYRKIIKPFIPRGIAKAVLNSKGFYALVHDQGKIVQGLDMKMLSSDGHPSFSKDGRFMITDTYEDMDNYRRLLLYDTLRVEILELGKFYSTFNSCGWRADLHPRFSPDEEHIIIDTTHNGHHQMLILKLHKKLLKKL